MTKKKVLIMSHDASLSGAPKLLLSLAKILKSDMNFEVDFFLKIDGPLREEFQSIGNVILPIRREGLSLRLSRVLGLPLGLDLSFIPKNSYDFIFCNSIVNSDIIGLIRSVYKGKIVSYIHELKVVTDHLVRESSKESLVKNVDLFFAPCLAVKEFLVNSLGVDSARVQMLPYFIPSQPSARRNSNEKFTVGGCGPMELRKGADLFIRLACEFRDKHPDTPISFLWQSSSLDSLDYKFLAQDIDKLGLSGLVSIMPPTKSTDGFFSSLDVFLLTSREDPYPLVVLEAANASVPSICFGKSGGAAEFVEGNGTVVNYLDIDGMVSAIDFYNKNPERKIEDGRKANIKLRELHQNKELIIDKIEKLIS